MSCPFGFPKGSGLEFKMSRLSDPQLLLLNKVCSSKEFKAARGSVTPGTHQIEDFTVHIRGGTLQVSEDTEREATARLLNEATLAFFIRRLGCTRDFAMKALREAALEAQDVENGVKKALLEETGVAETLKVLKAEVVAAMPKIQVKGGVKARAGVVLDEAQQETVAIDGSTGDFTDLPEQSDDDVDEFVMLINAK